MTAYIGYANFFALANSVTVTTETAGFSKENAYDYNTFDSWKPTAASNARIVCDMGSAVTANSWGIAMHTLGSGTGSPWIRAQYSSDNFVSDFHNLDDKYYPTNNNVYYRITAQGTARYWRFGIQSLTPIPRFGNMFIGFSHALPRENEPPFETPQLSSDDLVLTNVSDDGDYIGRSVINRGSKFSIKQNLVPESWIDANWEEMVTNLDIHPFYYMWDQENEPTQSAYCWANKINQPVYQHSNLLSFSIECGGRTI